MSAIDDLPPLREVISRHGLRAKRSLGQNFLLDLNLTARIARAAGPLDSGTIVEIGPGPGGLTRALLAHGARRIIAVERDQRAEPLLPGHVLMPSVRGASEELSGLTSAAIFPWTSRSRREHSIIDTAPEPILGLRRGCTRDRSGAASIGGAYAPHRYA